jgi:hypothetical protein
MKKSDESIWLAILADPHATENKWLEAALRLDTRKDGSEPWWYQLAWRFPITVTAIVAFIGSYACCAYVDLGFDWGYRLVQHWFGQPGAQASNQGMFAIFALAHIIFPLNLGLSFACAKRYFGGSKKWLPGLIGTMMVSDFIWFGFVDPGFKPMCFCWLACNLSIGLLAFEFGSSVIDRFYTHWNVRQGGFINVRRVFPLCAIYLVPSLLVALASMCGISLDLRLVPEMLMYGLPLFLIGLRAYRPCGSVALCACGSALVLAPVAVACLTNLFGTTFALALDAMGCGPDLGWRASMSALYISTYTASATALGCLCGALLNHVERKLRAQSGHGSHSTMNIRPSQWDGPR